LDGVLIVGTKPPEGAFVPLQGFDSERLFERRGAERCDRTFEVDLLSAPL
jgi:hypothetical protein